MSKKKLLKQANSVTTKSPAQLRAYCIDSMMTELPDAIAGNPVTVAEVLGTISTVLQLENELRVKTVRRQVLRTLKKLSVPDATELVAAAFDSGNDSGTPAPAMFALPEPYAAGPVDGVVLLDELRDVFRRYVSLPDHAAEALALFVVHTFAHDLVDTSPILAVTSPVKRCGKTTLLAVLLLLCAKAIGVSNMTAATVYRLIGSDAPTLIIDEADTFLDQNDLRGVLNAGFNRGAVVYRVVNGEPTAFSTWAAKIIACIGKLADTLQDRSVEIRLQRKSITEKFDRLSDTDPQIFATITSKAVAWVNANATQLRAAKPTIPSGLDDRACDKWRPLLAIAEVAGGHWPKSARTAAAALSGVAEQHDDSATAMLLADLRDIFGGGTRQLETKVILQRLAEMDERPWARFKHGRALSSFDLARLLVPFGVKSRTLRLGARTAKGYVATDLNPVFTRYATQPVTASHNS